MRSMQLESVLQTKNRSELAKNRFPVALVNTYYGTVTWKQMLERDFFEGIFWIAYILRQSVMVKMSMVIENKVITVC